MGTLSDKALTRSCFLNMDDDQNLQFQDSINKSVTQLETRHDLFFRRYRVYRSLYIFLMSFICTCMRVAVSVRYLFPGLEVRLPLLELPGVALLQLLQLGRLVLHQHLTLLVLQEIERKKFLTLTVLYHYGRSKK